MRHYEEVHYNLLFEPPYKGGDDKTGEVFVKVLYQNKQVLPSHQLNNTLNIKVKKYIYCNK